MKPLSTGATTSTVTGRTTSLPGLYEAAPLACKILSSAFESHPVYLLRPLTMKVG